MCSTSVHKAKTRWRRTKMNNGPVICDPMERVPRVQEIPDKPKTIPNLSTSRPETHNIGTHLASRIEELGVKDYFVVPGDFNLTLLDEVLKNKNLRMIGCCNELNAGYPADGYARSLPTHVAVVIVSFMVGGLSVVNAIAGAYSDNLKVIVVSGCPPHKTFGQKNLLHHSLGGTDRDQPLRMIREVTTAAVRLDNPQSAKGLLDDTISKCLKDSLPVYIEIPLDLVTLPSDSFKPLLIEEQPRLLPAISQSDLLDAVVETWTSAKRPVVLLGRWARGIPTDLLLAFIEKLGCPVFCQPDAKSLVPETHPQFAGSFWLASSDGRWDDIVMQSDLWVVIGGRWLGFSTLGEPIDPTKDAGCSI